MTSSDRSPPDAPATGGTTGAGGNDRETPPPAGHAAGSGGFRFALLLAFALLAGAGVGALALYGMNAGSGNAPAPQNAGTPHAPAAQPGEEGTAGRCSGAVARAAALQPYTTGDMARMQLARAPRPLPPLSFTGPDGAALTLDDFRGRMLLINLWATWCAPCREEMPALDRLEAERGGDAFAVVAINVDVKDMTRARAFLEEIAVRRLRPYVDVDTRSFQALRTVGRGFGLPSTLLVDGEGCELGFLAGPAVWDGPAAQALIHAATQGK